MLDVVTDIYVISTYYQSDELVGQANALLLMISLCVVIQLGLVMGNYREKKSSRKLKEVLITIFFLRPAVDAYRVSTNQKDNETAVGSLIELAANKMTEMTTESIPGCVLQLYVWLTHQEQAGEYALVSIAISALTTGYTSALIAFDMDVDPHHRKTQPKFYGYIPDERPHGPSNIRRGCTHGPINICSVFLLCLDLWATCKIARNYAKM